MKLKYYLIHNPIAEDPKECRAQITNYESVTEKEIFDYITRKGSGITVGEVKRIMRKSSRPTSFF